MYQNPEREKKINPGNQNLNPEKTLPLSEFWHCTDFFFHCPDFSLFVFFPLDFVHPDFVTPDCVVELLFVLFFDFVFC